MTSSELHFFSGTAATVAQGLYALSPSVVKQTVWALLLADPNGARIHLMERSDEAHGRVQVWSGAGLGAVPGQLVAAFALGSAPWVAQVREVLRAHGDYDDLGVVPCPPTARGAFGHPMRLHAQAAQLQAIVVAG